MGEVERENDWDEELPLECCDCDFGEEVSTVRSRSGIVLRLCFFNGAIFRSRGAMIYLGKDSASLACSCHFKEK